MYGTRMVPLVAVPSEFAARVLVAKLGSAGLLAEVRGVSLAYPAIGTAQVWVEEGALGDARELIADHDAFPTSGAAGAETSDRGHAGHHRLRPVVAAVALVLLGSIPLATRCSATLPAAHR